MTERRLGSAARGARCVELPADPALTGYLYAAPDGAAAKQGSIVSRYLRNPALTCRAISMPPRTGLRRRKFKRGGFIGR